VSCVGFLAIMAFTVLAGLDLLKESADIQMVADITSLIEDDFQFKFTTQNEFIAVVTDLDEATANDMMASNRKLQEQP